MKALRASRISEVEWNARRQRLEGLYLDDDLSRQEVVEIMAREDNFFATEKQLKYQFNKWGLKKYISDQDLTAMLSLKRKRQELGKNTGFLYRGHLVEQERLERASKRRKEPLMSSPDLPPYIRALVSPRQSPQMTCFLSSHRQTPAVPDGIQEATHDSGGPGSLNLVSNNSFHQSGDSGLNDAFNSLDVFPNPTLFYDGEQNQVNGGLWETLLDNSIVSFSPGHRSFMPTPSGRDIQATRTEDTSPLTRQITSIPPYVPAAQSAHDDGLLLFDSNIDLDFSMFLNSPRRLSTAPSSCHTESHPRRSVDRRSISPLQLTDYDDTHRENREFNLISETNSAAPRALDLVTMEDVTAESIASLLLLLRSLVFPRFDTASQKYEYQNSILSDTFCPQLCEWLCFEFEELLDLYLEKSLRSIRKRRRARIQSSLASGCNFNLNECIQGFDSSDESKQVSEPTEAAVGTKMRSTFYRYCSLPTGYVLFRVRGGPISPMGEERIDSNSLIIISYIPLATERTPGLCVQFPKMMGGPAISPQINTFNVVPYDSAIIQCVRENDIRGIQTLFDRGKASARDVDPRGISLLYYALHTGCSDVFRLLLQGGASTNACRIGDGRLIDIVTVIWNAYVIANSGVWWVEYSFEKLKNFEQCVAMTQLAIANGCTIDSARDGLLAADTIGSPVDVNNLRHSVRIRNPSYVLKDRVKTKLKILLEAGCDPNDFDDNGQSPDDYARHGLWSQWLWALARTGYVFDEEQNRWIKRIDTA